MPKNLMRIGHQPATNRKCPAPLYYHQQQHSRPSPQLLSILTAGSGTLTTPPPVQVAACSDEPLLSTSAPFQSSRIDRNVLPTLPPNHPFCQFRVGNPKLRCLKTHDATRP